MIVYLDLDSGRVTIELKSDLAPNHVARIKELARQGFYDGLTFHRVIEGFMAQTGDPRGDGTGGSGTKLKAEFSSGKHVRGTVSMARAGHPDSADSQFFIVLAPAKHLTGRYTLFAEVEDGMDVAQALTARDPSGGGSKPPAALRGACDAYTTRRTARLAG